MKKLIVSRDEAKIIRDADGCFILKRELKSPIEGIQNEHLRKMYPVGARFWVAEPINSIGKDGTRQDKYSIEPTPEGWRVCTLDRPGSRVHFGEHRFEVKVVKSTIETGNQYCGWFRGNVEFVKITANT